MKENKSLSKNEGNNKANRLFIIGNGFDLAHGYPTAYKDFRDWCREKLKNVEMDTDEAPTIPFETLGNHGEEIYNEEDLVKLLMWLLTRESVFKNDPEWNEFEQYLHDLDLEEVLNANSCFVYADLDNDPYDNEISHEVYDMEMYACALRNAVGQISDIFSEWIGSVKLATTSIPLGKIIKDRNSTGDLFLTFNYTETLETMYGVKTDQICYIHGKRFVSDKLIIGHGNTLNRDFYNRIPTAADTLEDAIRMLKKDTAQIIQKNAAFWDDIGKANIEEIYSFGFSFSDVDMPYIRKVISKLTDNTIWYLYIHGGDSSKYTNELLSAGYRGQIKIVDDLKDHLTPLVTIIITTYKRTPEMVVRATLSVCNQTYRNLEIIIVDDSPSDYADRMNVYEAVKNIGDPRITYLFNEKNIGACASRNRAIEASNGEFIMYVDDDDELLEKCVELRLEKFTSPKVGLVYSDCYVLDEEKGEKTRSNQAKHAGMVFDELIKENFVFAFPMMRRECFEKCGLFDVKMQAAQDSEMWLRIALKYEFNYVNEPLSVVHFHKGERISTNPTKKIQGLERLSEIYADYLNEHPDAYYIRTIKLAPFYIKLGDKKRRGTCIFPRSRFARFQ